MDWIKQFCAKDCPDTCGFLAKIDDGDLVIQPKDWDFLDKPFVCRKLKFFFEREVKNNSAYNFINFKKVSVDEVINGVADLLRDVLKSKKRVLYYRGSGNLGYGMFVWDLLLSQFNSVYFVDGSPCDETGIEAHLEDFGVCTNPPITNLEGVDNIIIFGKNAFVCSPHLYAYLKKLKKDKRIIYIDPVKTQTARISHEYIQNRLGSDGVVANAILSLMGYQEAKFYNFKKITGLGEEELKLLVDTIKRGKTAIIEGYGLQRYTNGKNSIKWLNRLAFYTGNMDFLYYSRSSKEGLQKPVIEPENKIFISDITNYLEDGFFDVIFIVAANPIMSLPDNEIWEKALEKAKVIVVDTNFTQTSSYADFFIKVGGMFAQSDVQGSYFFDKTLRKEALMKTFTDIDAAKEIAKRLDVKIDFSTSVVKKEYVGSRRNNLEDIPVKLPENNNGKIRLLSLPHPSYLNSQNNPSEIESIYVSGDVLKKLKMKEDCTVTVKNGAKEYKFILRSTDNLKGSNAFVYKSRSKSVNHIFKTRPTDTKRGLAFNDTFVEIKGE